MDSKLPGYQDSEKHMILQVCLFIFESATLEEPEG